MATRKIENSAQLTELIESGELLDGALVSEQTPSIIKWLVYDTEDGLYAVRPCNEDDSFESWRTGRPILFEFDEDSFDLPLYVTFEERDELSRPRVVCICGSTRFRSEIAEANRVETLAGRIVVAPGVYGHDGDPMTDEDKTRLDELHRRKIDLADEVLVVNPGGYIGHSTGLEIGYAQDSGKPVRYTCPAEEVH